MTPFSILIRKMMLLAVRRARHERRQIRTNPNGGTQINCEFKMKNWL